MMIFFLGLNYKIEFMLDNVARVESRAFSLPAQSVSSGSGSGSGGGGGGGSSRASTVGTAAQMTTIVTSCLMGRVLLLEIFMAAVLTLNVSLSKRSLFCVECMPPPTELPVNKEGAQHLRMAPL